MADQQTKTDIKAAGWVIAISAAVIVLAAFIVPHSVILNEVRGIYDWMFIWAMVTAAYFTPAIIAYFRSHSQLLAIVLLNILLGWTGIGWLAAFVWAIWFD
jgi:T4 superinfection immunity protein